MDKISIVIPCRNEEQFIAKCLDSLLVQEGEKDALEILVVDGMSTDKTREVVKNYSARDARIKLLDNQNLTTPYGMNIGIGAASGEFVVISSAHASYQPDYLSICLRYIKEHGADMVGGMADTLPAKPTPAARAIALVLRSKLGAGGSYFRTGTDKPRLVDAVFGSFIKKEVFAKVGYYNEKMTRSQDIEFNKRLIASGGKILLIPELKIAYYPKPTFGEFWQHNIQDGAWAILPWRYGVVAVGPRHLIPVGFVIALGTLFALGMISSAPRFLFFALFDIYMAVVLWHSFAIAASEKYIALMPHLFVAFLIRHFGYGIGSLIGIYELVVRR